MGGRPGLRPRLPHQARGVAGPGTLDGVLELARVAAMEDFDRARPLWEVTLFDGLDDGGAAVVCKFHHALTDGVGGVQIGMILFDLSEQPADAEPMPPAQLVRAYPWWGVPQRARSRRETRRDDGDRR